jgi:3-oxoacyl-[acyl-carrier protein] reductase
MGNYFDLTGRSALVTGAAGGIGSAVAEALADAGAAVLVTDLDKDAAAAVAERISANGGRAESAALDVSDRDSADDALRPDQRCRAPEARPARPKPR